MTYRAALVGFGHIAQRAHMGALLGCGCSIVAVVEPCPSQRKLARALLPTAKLYTDMATMLAECKPELVDICTPPHLHFGAAMQALRHGAHVLCEKPLVTDPKDAVLLQRLAQQKRLVVTCVHNWTEAPVVKAALDLVHRGALGALQSVEVLTLRKEPAHAAGTKDNWRIHPEQAGGGILFDHGWHGLSIILQAAGSGIASVSGDISQKRHYTLEVEDTVDTKLQLHNGVRGRCMCTWAANSRSNTMTFVGSRGTAVIVDDTLTVKLDQGQPTSQIFDESLAEGGYRVPWTAAIVEEFLAEIAGRTPHGDSLEEAVQIMRAITATYESALDGGQVVLTSAEARADWRDAMARLGPLAA